MRFVLIIIFCTPWPPGPRCRQAPMAARAPWPPDPRGRQAPVAARPPWPPGPLGRQAPVAARPTWRPGPLGRLTAFLLRRLGRQAASVTYIDIVAYGCESVCSGTKCLGVD